MLAYYNENFWYKCPSIYDCFSPNYNDKYKIDSRNCDVVIFLVRDRKNDLANKTKFCIRNHHWSWRLETEMNFLFRKFTGKRILSIDTKVNVRKCISTEWSAHNSITGSDLSRETVDNMSGTSLCVLITVDIICSFYLEAKPPMQFHDLPLSWITIFWIIDFIFRPQNAAAYNFTIYHFFNYGVTAPSKRTVIFKFSWRFFYL